MRIPIFSAAIIVACLFPIAASAANLSTQCGRFSIKIYPNAIFMNGNKMDNAHTQTESDVMSYVFQEYAEMGGTYTLYSLDIPSRGSMTLTHQWQNADGKALRDTKTEKCTSFKSFKGLPPKKSSTLELRQ